MVKECKSKYPYSARGCEESCEICGHLGKYHIFRLGASTCLRCEEDQAVIMKVHEKIVHYLCGKIDELCLYAKGLVPDDVTHRLGYKKEQLKQLIEDNINKLMDIERLADKQHQIWSHWMKYMLSKGTYNGNGSWIMPKYFLNRWQEQMHTDYANLSEKEKESDRDIVRKFLWK